MQVDVVKIWTWGGDLMNFDSCLSASIEFDEFVQSIVKALEMKDSYTYQHSERVAQFARRIARELKIVGPQLDLIYTAAYLHDIGKIGIPESFLTKPGRLTLEEFRVVQSHSAKGFQILSQVKNLSQIALIVKHHHERFDGTGYPVGLKGDEIPFESRIIAVADAFDAMTSSRSYRGKLQIDEAICQMSVHRQQQFDATIVEVLEKLYHTDISFLEAVVSSGEEFLVCYEVDEHDLFLSRKL